MTISAGSGWTTGGAGRSVAGGEPLSLAIIRIARAACTATNLLTAGALILGWLALIAWTGSGSGGWQARICSDLSLQPASCGGIQPRKDESRVAPHSAATRSPA